MAGRIQGITAPIGGDTTKLQTGVSLWGKLKSGIGWIALELYSAVIKIRLMETVVVSISRFFNYSF